MFLLKPFTKMAKMVPLSWTKWPQEQNIEKSLNDISSLAIGPISKWFHACPFTKIAKMFPLCWSKWSPELKIDKPLNDISKASGSISK